MLRIAAMPKLTTIISKIDIKPIVEKLKGLNLFSDEKPIIEQLSKEKLGILGFEILEEITPQLGEIAEDIVPFVAAYKNVSIEEAEDLDAIETFKEIFKDSAVISFFRSALRKKAAPVA